MALAIWRQRLQPASYNSVPFKVAVQARASGKRLVPHEFPKRDMPWTERMGRRIRRFAVTGYIIYSPTLEPDYQATRDALIDEFERDATGHLRLPTGLEYMRDGNEGAVEVENYSVVERREQGGYCEIDVTFLEAGQATATAPSTDTRGAVDKAAQDAIGSLLQSDDISSLT